jgi:hypothetical protein
MTERAQLTLYLVIAILVVVLFIAVLLIRRHGHTIETAKIRSDIAGMRQQMDVEHGAIQDDLKATKGWMLRILNRFGFLKGHQ